MFSRSFFLLSVAAFFSLVPRMPAADSASVADSEATFLSHPRQLTYEGKRSGEGYFDPAGQRLIFQSEREEGNPFYQMYVLDLTSGETKRVSQGHGKTTCGFFQPGTNRVLFASTHLDPEATAKERAELEFRAAGKQRRYSWDYDESMDIFSARADGTDLVPLTHELGYDAEGAFSPDGKKIVFCSLRGAFPLAKNSPELQARYAKDPAYFGDIYTMNADGSDVQRLTEAPGYDGGPFFSPGGDRIVWRHFDESGMAAEIWTMKTDGSDKQKLTDFHCLSWAPFYHPSGRYLIFTANKLGFDNFELFLVDASGAHEPVRVTFTPGFDGLPVFSPDGKKLSWTSGRTVDGKSQIFLADWNDAAAQEALAASPLRTTSATPQMIEEKPSAAGEEMKSPDGKPLPLHPEISAEDLRLETRWLADPARAGRATGSPEAEGVAKALAAYQQSIGLQPLAASFLEPYEFIAGERLIREKCSLSGQIPGAKLEAKLDEDFRPLAFSDNGEAEGEIVFAGYGLSVPEGGGARYNSYENLDVKDKIVLLLRYVPEGVDAPRRAQLNRYAGIRYKALMARERGARAVLVVGGPNSPNAGELLPLTNDGSNSGSGILTASISLGTAEKLLSSSGKNLHDLQTALDTENPHAPSLGGFVLPGVLVKLSVGLEHLKRTDRNVVGAIPPAPGCEEYVLVGAHYDHLGRGLGGTSLARAGEEGQIHPGADDNASGTAVVMEIAAALAQERAAHPEKFRRGIAFAAWSGEEIGLMGSAAFCEHPPIPLTKIAAYVNFDMVGRLRENKLVVQGLGSAKNWRRLLEKRNVSAGFDLTLQDDPYLPTDVTSFYPKRIPVLNFFTGSHEDYHRPTDTPEKLDAEGMARIAQLARAIIEDLAAAETKPEFARVEHAEKSGGSRDTLRAYLGTIPDYSAEVRGVKLSGVRAESPADKAGLRGGDIVTALGGQKIANIYDYTFALDAVKIGTPVKMNIERAGLAIELTITPEARK